MDSTELVNATEARGWLREAKRLILASGKGREQALVLTKLDEAILWTFQLEDKELWKLVRGWEAMGGFEAGRVMAQLERIREVLR